MKALMVLTLALLLPAAAAASDDTVVVNTDARAIVSHQQQIRQQVLAGEGRFGDLDEADRRRLLDRQNKVLDMLDGKERSSELSRIDQVILFNSLEHISAIINDDEDGRMECERVRPTGSNQTQWLCMTVAERRGLAETSQQGLQSMQSNTYRRSSQMRAPPVPGGH